MDKYFFCLLLTIVFIGCCPNPKKMDLSNYPDEKFEEPGITNRDTLSAASKRALQWPDLGNEWFIEFKTSLEPFLLTCCFGRFPALHLFFQWEIQH